MAWRAGVSAQGEGKIRGRLMQTLLAADPFSGLALVIVAIGREAIAERAEGIAMFVIPALEAGEGQIVAIGVAEADGTHGTQVLVDIAQDVVEAFPGVAQNFANR